MMVILLFTVKDIGHMDFEVYKLTDAELGTVDFCRGRYLWADIVAQNLEGDTLTLDNMTQHEMNEAIEVEGIPLLDDRTDLFRGLISLEPV